MVNHLINQCRDCSKTTGIELHVKSGKKRKRNKAFDSDTDDGSKNVGPSNLANITQPQSNDANVPDPSDIDKDVSSET